MDEVLKKLVKNYDLLKILYEEYKHEWQYENNPSIIPVVEKKISDNIPSEYDTTIVWNRSLIEEYSDHFDWNLLSKNKSIPWDENLLDSFSDKLDISEWINISSNPLIKWDKRLINKYWDKIFVNVIISKSPIFWSEELVRYVISKHLKTETKIFWIDKFSVISNIEWTIKMIIDFPTSSWISRVIRGKRLKYNFQILKTYKDELTKDIFIHFQYSDTLIWSHYWIKIFKELINFDILSSSTNVVWSDALIFDLKDVLNFKNLSRNHSIILNENLVCKYHEQWDFKLLSKHSNVKFSEAIIKKFENKWDFAELSFNKAIKWHLNLIVRYISKVDINILLQSPIPGIDETFIREYKDYIKWESDSHDYTDGYLAAPIAGCNHLKIPLEILVEKATKWKIGAYNTGYWSKQNYVGSGEWHLFSNNWFLSYEYLKEFEYLLSWEVVSSNEHLNLTKEIIDDFHYDLVWVNIINRSNFSKDDFLLIQKHLSVELLNANKSKILEFFKIEKDSLIRLFESNFTKYDILRYHALRKNFETDYKRKKRDFLQRAKLEFSIKLCQAAISDLNTIKMQPFDEYKTYRWLTDNFELFDDLSYVSEDFQREVFNPYQSVNKIRNFVYTYLECEDNYKMNVPLS